MRSFYSFEPRWRILNQAEIDSLLGFDSLADDDEPEQLEFDF